MSIYATWLADVLRGAGLEVVEHPGWKTRGAPGRSYEDGGFVSLEGLVQHHDASPKGDSPGVPEFMLRNWATAAAQLWVDRDGVWHVLAAGVAWHAGRVRAGMPGNWTSLGVETDHTNGEDWPPAMLDSLRTGSAAILRHMKRTATRGLHFHKSICDPPGRKVDPDGLDLAVERRSVQIRLDRMNGAKPATPAPAKPAPAKPVADRTWTPPAKRTAVPPMPALVRLGSTGSAVRAVQERLKARGWRITVDGDFGPTTDRIVRAYQAEKGLRVDGVVGLATWRSLWLSPIV